MSGSKIRILGIDPGSRMAGYGIVDVQGRTITAIDHGTLRLSATHSSQNIPLEDRLHQLFMGLTSLIEKHRPEVMAIEKVFFAKNAVSALKLGQARGAAIVCGSVNGLSIVEYAPTEIKSAITGHGRAEKEQVAQMVQMLVGPQKFESADASDALAIAICHAQRVGTLLRSGGGATPRSTLEQAKRSVKKGSLAEQLGITPDRVEGKKRIRL